MTAAAVAACACVYAHIHMCVSKVYVVVEWYKQGNTAVAAAAADDVAIRPGSIGRTHTHTQTTSDLGSETHRRCARNICAMCGKTHRISAERNRSTPGANILVRYLS